MHDLSRADDLRAGDEPPGPGAGGVATSTDWALPVRRFFDYLISECGLADNTIEAYGRDLREFAALLVERGVGGPEHITTLLVQSHLIRLKERGLALSSIARHLA